MSDHKGPSYIVVSDLPIATAAGFIDRKELAATAFERVGMAMVIADARKADIPIVMANAAFLKLTGYESKEVLGRNCRFLQGEDSSPAAVAEIRAALSEVRELNIELLNYRKDGSSFWNRLHLSPVHDAEGKLLYFFASQTDVTDSRKMRSLEVASHQLLKEVDHRTKNVLAVVDGIVRLSRSNDANLYAVAIQQRVQALATAHSLLADSGWQAVTLDHIIHRLLESFVSNQISLEGPPIMVPAISVQPIALILSELAVNALSHGSLSASSGKLGIHWRARPPDNRLELQWKETGVKKPSIVLRQGFGTVMIDAMVEQQLHGSIRREWNNEGLVANISIPLSK